MALAAHLAGTVCDSIAEILLENDSAAPDPARVVNMVFDAFDKQGAGQLATWMILSGNENAMNPVVDAIHELVDEIGQGQPDKSMQEDTLTLVLLAMGDALLGEPLARSLGLPREAAREIAARLMMASPRLSGRIPAEGE
jgi:hypothetical protein